MAKKRKTRKDKIIADLKRELAKKKSTNLTPKLPKLNPIPTNINNINKQTNPYLKKDLTKSLALAILVIGFELVIYWQLR